jgi:hypothetical protein
MFDFAARPGTKLSQNGMYVRVLDSLTDPPEAAIVSERVTALSIQVVAKSAKPQWRMGTVTFVAPADGNVVLEFRGLGQGDPFNDANYDPATDPLNDTYGMFLDNVVVVPAKVHVRLHDAGRVAEGDDAVARFKVELLEEPAQDVAVYYATKFDTSGNDVTLIAAGINDFAHTAKGDHIVIPAGQTTGWIEIAVPPSGEAAEYSEEFMVVIANAPNGFIIPMADSTITQEQSGDFTGLTRFTPAGRAQIAEHGLAHGWDDWTVRDDSNRERPEVESLGYWRATEETLGVDQSIVTVTTPKGNSWTNGPDEAHFMNSEGPYLHTQAEVPYTDFRMTIHYATQDDKKHVPLPWGDRKDPTLTWNPRPESNEHYGNSGVYIFDRYEIQIIDPSAWGVGSGETIGDAGKASLTPGGVYKMPELENVPADSDLEFDPNGKDTYGYKYNFVNRAKGTGAWNTLVIEFRAPVVENDLIMRPAHVTTWLNPADVDNRTDDELVFKGWIVDRDGKAVGGTGSRATVTKQNPLVDKGRVYLQSHWGSQVEFRAPVFARL